MIGDYDPDDAWDATDAVADQLDVLGRRIVWLLDHRDDIEARIGRIVDDLRRVRIRVIDRDL
jgi:hypothetical protein